MQEQVINNMKSLGIDMIKKAGNGHSGIVLDAATMLYCLYAHHININVNDPKWPNRDRFVMSAGHGSAILYATLYMAGYLTKEDLMQFRQIDSRTPGHPEVGVTPGVEASTGPLGQGIATAVGLALGEKILEHRFVTSKGESLFHYHVYVLCSDGDLMEGISYEAASLAGTWKLNNLIVLYDSNKTSLDGSTDMTFTENVRARFEAMGWDTELVKDGENVAEIDRAIAKAKKNDKPTLIEVQTIIGNGSKLAGSHEVHGKVLDDEDIYQLKGKWGIDHEPFTTLPNTENMFRAEMLKHTKPAYEEWSKRYQDYHNEHSDLSDLDFIFGKKKEIDLLKTPFSFMMEEKEATRKTNATFLNHISREIPYFIGGSADLSTSVKSYIDRGNDLTKDNYLGKNIWFGVREHAMGAILNGLALTNFQVFGSTFLTFSDYLKPAIRMSSLMKLPVIYLLSHDSIEIGSDGPTHQPVEQLAMLRSEPNLNVYRPCDGKELLGCWNHILKEKEKPSALILSKVEVEQLATTSSEEVAKGAYVVRKENQYLHGILIATGNQVHTALRIATKLYEREKLDLRVVSMPCMELFLEQPKEYRDALLPKGIRTVVIEAGSSFGWHQFVYNSSYLLTIDHFGASGSRDQILKKYHYDYKSLEERVKKLFL